MAVVQDYDVIIVGGGMTGASLALALADSSLSIALIDQEALSPEPVAPSSMYTPRVSALTEASINLFKNLGVWSFMTDQRTCPYSQMFVWDNEGTGAIEFDADSVSKTSIGSIVENKVIRQGVLAGLKNTTVDLFERQTDLRFDLGIVSARVTLSDGRVLNTQLMVAADGAESRLRQLAAIPSSQNDYLHHAVVTTVQTEKYHQDTAWQVFRDTGPLAFLPLPSMGEKHYCSIVWSQLPCEADKMMALGDDAFISALEKAFEKKLGRIEHVEPRFCFPLRQRHANAYYRNNIVLVGDAAHTIHPLAGQGVNLGLMDVAVLTEELIKAVERGDNFAGQHILAHYQRRRKGHNLAMIMAMKGFQNLFAADHLAIRWLRNTGLKAVNKLPLLKELIVRQALGTSGVLPLLAQAPTRFG